MIPAGLIIRCGRKARAAVRHLWTGLGTGPRRSALRIRIGNARPLKVSLGSGAITAVGWIETDADLLDVTSIQSWSRLFLPESIDRLMAEHLFEHLSDSRCTKALAHCFNYLKPGGLLRIAVPDGHRRDPEYVREVSPPNDGHQLLFTVESLIERLTSIGFRTTPLEYFDEAERFHSHPWDEADGLIRRSVRYDTQERFRKGRLCYTSLIVDARKPCPDPMT